MNAERPPLTLLDILHAARNLRAAGIAPRDLSHAIRGALALIYGKA